VAGDVCPALGHVAGTWNNGREKLAGKNKETFDDFWQKGAHAWFQHDQYHQEIQAVTSPFFAQARQAHGPVIDGEAIRRR